MLSRTSGIVASRVRSSQSMRAWSSWTGFHPSSSQPSRVPTTNRLRSFSSTTRVASSSGGALADVCQEHLLQSPFPTIPRELYDRPLPDFLLSEWKRQGLNDSDEHLAIRDSTTGMSRTFGDYYRDTRGLAGSLRHDLGIGTDSTVCLYAPNHVDYLPVTLAVGLCGAKMTPVNPLSTAAELQTVLEQSGSSVLLAHPANLEVALEAAKGVDHVKHVLVLTEDGATAPHGLESLESLKQHSQGFDTTSDAYDCDPTTHPYLLPYSSGTTGLPKGVCLSHSNLTVNLLQIDAIEGTAVAQVEADPDQHRRGLVSPLPFFHIYGMVVSMMYYSYKGWPVYTNSGRFDLVQMLETIQTHQPSHAHLVPPIILGLAKHPVVDQFDVSSLTSILSAASPLGSDTETAVRNRLQGNCVVKQGWGMSELSPIGSLSPLDDVREGSVGPLASNTAGKIIDPATGKSLGPHEEGELVLRGPQVMMGYLDEPEKTRDCLSDSGWLRTGDFAYADEDGFLYITDRIKELIKVRGFPVAPAELEDLLLGHPLVNDVAVIQCPDEASGELPRAYVVLQDGDAVDPEAAKASIYDWTKERVAPHKRLDGGIVVCDAIPKSASGKILRRILRDELAAERTPGSTKAAA